MTIGAVSQPAALCSLVASRSLTALQSVDVATIAGLPGPVKAAGSFLLVVLFGGVALRWSEPRVHRSLDALRDRPYIAAPYGLVGYAIAFTVGAYGLSQLGRLGVANTPLGRLVGLVLVGSLVALTAFGFLVVGTLLTEIRGQPRPVYGLVVGGVLSAVGWLVLPALWGVVVWVLVAAVGLGGGVRRWLHDERTVETERPG